MPAQQWITIYNAHRPMKQRYHYNVANSRIEQHVDKGNDDGLFISSVSCAQELWALIMDAGTGFNAQSWELSTQFLPKDWILEQWDDGYYITALAGSTTGSALVIMSKGTLYTQQSYKVSDSFPFKWINKKWKEGFYVTSMATSGTRWAVVKEPQRRGSWTSAWSWTSCTPRRASTGAGTAGFRITCCAATLRTRRRTCSAPRAAARRTRRGDAEDVGVSPRGPRKSGLHLYTSAGWLPRTVS